MQQLSYCRLPGFELSAQMSLGFGIQVPLPEQTVLAMFGLLRNDSWSGSGVLQEKITSSPSSVDTKG